MAQPVTATVAGHISSVAPVQALGLDRVKLLAAIVYALAVMLSSGPQLTLPLPAISGLGWKRVVPADAAFVALLAVFAIAALRQGRAAFPRPVWREPLVVFVAMALSVAFSASVARGLPDLARLAYSIVAYGLIAQVEFPPARARTFAAWYVGGAVAVTTLAAAAYVAAFFGHVTPLVFAEPGRGWQATLAVRMLGPFSHPTTLAVFLTSALFFAAALGLLTSRPAVRRGCMAAGVLFVTVLLLTSSRAVGGLIVTAFVWSLLSYRPRPRNIVAVVLLGQLALVMTAAIVASVLWNILPVTVIREPDTKFVTIRIYAAPELRGLIYRGALRVFAQHPVLGVGPGSFAEAVKPTIRFEEVWAASRYYVRDPDQGARAFFEDEPDPHSSLFGWLARTGIVGVGAMLWFVARRAQSFLRPRGLAPPADIVGRLAFAFLAGFVANGIFVEMLHLRFVWVFLAYATALTVSVSRGEHSGTPDA
jgi:O-antigen ligase